MIGKPGPGRTSDRQQIGPHTQPILDLIRGAQRSVDLLFYMFNDDAAGAAVRDELADAAAIGERLAKLDSPGGPRQMSRAALFDGRGRIGGETSALRFPDSSSPISLSDRD